MKKVLSVLVAAIMLISCCSVGLVSFAANPSSIDEAVELIAWDTEFMISAPTAVANAGLWNEREFQYGTGGYTFSRLVSSSSTKASSTAINAALNVTNDNNTPDDETDDIDVLDTIKRNIRAAYEATGAYADYITVDTSTGALKSINLETLASDTVDLDSLLNDIDVTAQTAVVVGKNGDAEGMLGENALKKLDIDVNDLADTSTVSKFVLDSITVASDNEEDVLCTIEDSTLAKYVSGLISSDTAAQLKADLEAKEGVKDVKNYKFQISNIAITPTYSTATYSSSENIDVMGKSFASGTSYNVISGYKVSYDISFTADVAFDAFTVDGVEDSYFTYTGKKTATHNYISFQRPTASDLTASELLGLINSETKRYAENTDDSHSAGYIVNKTVSTTTSFSFTQDEQKIINNILQTHYGDRFADYLAIDAYGDGIVYYDKILIDILGLDSVSATVSKGVDGSEVVGDNALIAMTLSENNLSSLTGSSLSGTLSIKYNDVDLLASGTASEDSAVADYYNNYLADGIYDAVVDSLEANVYGTTLEDASLKYTNITITPTFTQIAANDYELASIQLSYNIEFSANLYAADAVNPIDLKNVTNVTVKYSNFDEFDESSDIDVYDFAEILNAATAYVVSDKAGYDYERNSSITSTPVVTGSLEGSTVADIIGTIDGLLGTLTSLIGSSDMPITEALSSALLDIFKESLDVTDYTGTVPATKTASDVIGANAAVKATSVQAADIYNLQYDATRGVITFTLLDVTNPEKDEENALSRLTNDFTSVSEAKDKLSVSLSDNLNIQLSNDSDSCNVTYTGINFYVAFNGADENNVYGDGTLAKFGVNYNCDLNVQAQGLVCSTKQQVLAESNDFTYVDYELGDADQSGKVSIVDARLVLQYIVGTATLTDAQKELADMDLNGKITVADAKLILQKVASQTA